MLTLHMTDGQSFALDEDRHDIHDLAYILDGGMVYDERGRVHRVVARHIVRLTETPDEDKVTLKVIRNDEPEGVPA